MSERTLKIGNLTAKIPVVQGGMGVGISLSHLAGAVAKAGGVGVISTAQIGFRDKDYAHDPLSCNLRAIGSEIKKARDIAPNGVIGVNIMVATLHYEDYVRAAVKAGADIVISGAGLPMNLPELTAGSQTKIAPIVSSNKALSVITRQWERKYSRIPDMVVIEGPMAGGHLGFSEKQLAEMTVQDFDREVVEIIKSVRELENRYETKIPVVVGGGVFEREDMEHYLSLGADGVQIATRFVATDECDAAKEYKEAYIHAKKEDIMIIKSPVGMPGRAVRNLFLDRVLSGERIMSSCRQCIKTCNPATTPYCITKALINAAIGNVDEGLIFCGSNVDRVKEIVPVEKIMEEFA
ncbi:MAG: NAD(P)H-dependent flavin oxidoreductase [Lachnospiraceae bacterium]